MVTIRKVTENDRSAIRAGFNALQAYERSANPLADTVLSIGGPWGAAIPVVAGLAAAPLSKLALRGAPSGSLLALDLTMLFENLDGSGLRAELFRRVLRSET